MPITLADYTLNVWELRDTKNKYVVSKRWDGINRKWVDRRYERELGKEVESELVAQLRHYLKIASDEGRSVDWAFNQVFKSTKCGECVGAEPGGYIAVVMRCIKEILGRYGRLAYNVALYLSERFSSVLKENNKKIRNYITFREALNRLRKISVIGFKNEDVKIMWRWYIPDDELVAKLVFSVQLRLPFIHTFASL